MYSVTACNSSSVHNHKRSLKFSSFVFISEFNINIKKICCLISSDFISVQQLVLQNNVGKAVTHVIQSGQFGSEI